MRSPACVVWVDVQNLPRVRVSVNELEPACGQGHRTNVLAEYFGGVKASDIPPTGTGLLQFF